MKSSIFLLPALLLTACGTSSGPTGSSGSAQEEMAAKLVTFQQRFDRYDDNGDGFLSRQEVAAGLANDWGEELTPDTVPFIFAFYDTNRDNRISLAEINAGYEAGPEAALRFKEAWSSR